MLAEFFVCPYGVRNKGRGPQLHTLNTMPCVADAGRALVASAACFGAVLFPYAMIAVRTNAFVVTINAGFRIAADCGENGNSRNCARNCLYFIVRDGGVYFGKWADRPLS